MARRKYTEEDRETVREIYRETGSSAKAAEAVGASASWAWGVCKEAGLVDPAPQYTTSDVREARRLYVEEELSCRDVAAAMAPDGPSTPSAEGHELESMSKNSMAAPARFDAEAAKHGLFDRLNFRPTASLSTQLT